MWGYCNILKLELKTQNTQELNAFLLIKCESEFSKSWKMKKSTNHNACINTLNKFLFFFFLVPCAWKVSKPMEGSLSDYRLDGFLTDF